MTVASGRFVLRLPPELHRALRQTAARQGVSLNTVCVQLLGGHSGNRAPMQTIPASWDGVVQRYTDAHPEECVGVLLFGSAARGELRGESDIDLLFVLHDSVPLRRGLYAAWDARLAEQALDREINAHFVHLPRAVEDASSLWLEVAVEGRVLRDRSGEIERFVVELRRAIASGRFIRGISHGQPYWRRSA
jgi:predicted nucleotidyltransferase